MVPYVASLTIGTSCLIFALVIAIRKPDRHLFGSTLVDSLLLAFVGANVLIFSYFGMRP